MIKHFCFLFFAICSALPLFAQAGKLEKSAFRLKFAGVTGIFASDWEKRNQDFSFVYARAIEDNWKDQNIARGVRMGAEYYASLKDPLFTHLLFGVNVSELKGSFPTTRVNETQIQTLNYKGNLQQIELTFGTVISVFEPFRVIPKFVHRSMDQTLSSNKSIFISDPENSQAAAVQGKESIRSRSTSGYLGIGLEYDLTPNFTIYFDSLLFNNVLFSSQGKYSVSGSAEGYLISNGAVGVSNRVDSSSGTYKMSGNRFLLGGSLKVSDSVRLFVSAERDTIYSEISQPFGSNVVITSLVSSRLVAAQADVVNKTIAENLIYTQRQKLETTTLQFGISRDFDP
jgi:hypothetical protein